MGILSVLDVGQRPRLVSFFNIDHNDLLMVSDSTHWLVTMNGHGQHWQSVCESWIICLTIV